MKVVTSHQPTFAPYPMLFARIAMADIFDLSGSYDQVGHGSDSFNQRVKVGDSVNGVWLRSPVDKFKLGSNFWDIPINSEHLYELLSKLRGFFNSRKREYSQFSNNIDFIENLLTNSTLQYSCLATFNSNLISEFMNFLGIKTELKLGFEAPKYMNASEKILYQVQKSNADIYLSGDNGINYLDPIPFVRAELPIVYASQFGDFLEAKKFFTEHNLHTTSIISSIFKIPQDELKDVFSRIQKISDLL